MKRTRTRILPLLDGDWVSGPDLFWESFAMLTRLSRIEVPGEIRGEIVSFLERFDSAFERGNRSGDRKGRSLTVGFTALTVPELLRVRELYDLY